ncbi:MAG: formimidoylglutamase [Verrucomicrobia bacterium RIFCSPHIGHO2_12_FULL_41_10]|nr:MAG: formimidoylglutamase [Verrucomicrobia bacterium RIFCSPHIGHO2_12_FULL_41_10]HLB33081.1 formimidoylglutamase [Chthoniobacterales bacterium]
MKSLPATNENDLDRYYIPPSSTCWTGRDDEPNSRLFQQIQALDCRNLPSSLPPLGIALLGFSCDEGVLRNQGRLGAAQGPESLRKALRNLPLPPDKTFSIWDAGTVICTNGDLETAQQVLGKLVSQLRQRGAFVVVLGGGHEVAWGHFQGLVDSTGLDVVNFDAHFDLRPLLSGGKGSSGTCFRQMHGMCQAEKIPWRYACLGIQPFGNTSSLFDYAASIGTYHCLAEAMVSQPERVHEALATWLSSSHRIYLTLCLDVFAAAYAPGVSAPQAMGLSPQTLLPFFRQVLQSGKVIGFDVAELNPTYDRDDQTAALAAYFVAEVCYQCHFISAK